VVVLVLHDHDYHVIEAVYPPCPACPVYPARRRCRPRGQHQCHGGERGGGCDRESGPARWPAGHACLLRVTSLPPRDPRTVPRKWGVSERKLPECPECSEGVMGLSRGGGCRRDPT